MQRESADLGGSTRAGFVFPRYGEALEFLDPGILATRTLSVRSGRSSFVSPSVSQIADRCLESADIV